LRYPKANVNRTRFGDQTFTITGPRLWNSLSTSLHRTDTELGEFKQIITMY